MSNDNTARISPALITWAIERSGIDRQALSTAIKVPLSVIEDWEAGESYPLFPIAQKFARATHTPFGYLFLSVPPKEDIPLPDLRTRDGRSLSLISANFRSALYLVLLQHDWYKEYAQEQGLPELPFVGKFTSHDSEDLIAADIRTVLRVRETRRRSKTWNEFLTALCDNAEDVGILVMRRGHVEGNTRRSLSKDEFQGFAISNKQAPLVFINANDSIATRIFTWAHEIAHIWIGATGISQIEEIPEKHQIEIEVFCNRIAAEVLVPKAEFTSLWKGSGQLAEINDLAQIFLVSTLVILRRARELGLLSVPDFIRLLDETSKHLTDSPNRRGPDYRRKLDYKNSQTIVDAVISHVKGGRTTYLDGARLIGARLPTFIKVMEGLYKT